MKRKKIKIQKSENRRNGLVIMLVISAFPQNFAFIHLPVTEKMDFMYRWTDGGGSCSADTVPGTQHIAKTIIWHFKTFVNTGLYIRMENSELCSCESPI